MIIAIHTYTIECCLCHRRENITESNLPELNSNIRRLAHQQLNWWSDGCTDLCPECVARIPTSYEEDKTCPRN